MQMLLFIRKELVQIIILSVNDAQFEVIEKKTVWKKIEEKKMKF